jgi:hypothetical protein
VDFSFALRVGVCVRDPAPAPAPAPASRFYIGLVRYRFKLIHDVYRMYIHIIPMVAFYKLQNSLQYEYSRRVGCLS